MHDKLCNKLVNCFIDKKSLCVFSSKNQHTCSELKNTDIHTKQLHLRLNIFNT